MRVSIGVDAIACHVPRHFIELTDLAEARGVSPSKYEHGLGQRHMAIAMPPEDPVYLAVSAARKAIDRFGIDPSEIGYLAVGTETGVDHSKPVSIYLHEALGLRSNCLVFEAKHACFGASAALGSALDWLSAGSAKGSKALIVATDIARYGLRTAGEPTQGAGAVALVVSENPRLFSFDHGTVGTFARNVMDFWRPLYRKEALTDGHYSISCYLDALRGTLADLGPAMPSLPEIQACLYHVPFAKMAHKAHRAHLEVDEGGDVPADDERFVHSYQAKVAPWLTLNGAIGNIYTGSVYLSLLDLLRQGTAVPGEPVALFSYGSGCAASMRIGRPVEGYVTHGPLLDPGPELEARVRLTVEEYEEVMRVGDTEIELAGTMDPANWGLDPGDFFYLGVKEHVRIYSGLGNESPLAGVGS